MYHIYQSRVLDAFSLAYQLEDLLNLNATHITLAKMYIHIYKRVYPVIIITGTSTLLHAEIEI